MHLTQHPRHVESAPRDRPENEVEVTPEMVEAGIDSFYTYSWGECHEIDAEEIRAAMKAAFIAMWQSQP